MAYTIGQKTFSRGDEITITTEAYELYGGLWQDGTDEHGKTVTLPVPEYVANRVAESQAKYKAQQATFSRISKIK